jgi:predicted RNase H-like HicB family nuclease
MGGKHVFRYPIVIERAKGNLSAYSPDLPGCVATGSDIKEVLQNMRSAVLFHLEGLRNEGIPIPEPSTTVQYIEVSL